jgi:uncharacterized protein (UPF0548 family)
VRSVDRIKDIKGRVGSGHARHDRARSDDRMTGMRRHQVVALPEPRQVVIQARV